MADNSEINVTGQDVNNIQADRVTVKQGRIGDTHRVGAVTPQTDEAQLAVAKSHRVFCAPLEVGKTSRRDVIDL